MSDLHDLIFVATGEPEGSRTATPASEAPTACRNCGNRAAGSYCPVCGQQKGGNHLSLRTLILRVADEALSINGKLPVSLFALIFRPGFLTREYVEGRIVRYVRPMRLYIVFSVLFFLLLSLPDAIRSYDGPGSKPDARADSAAETAPAASEAEPGGHWANELVVNAKEDGHWTDGLTVQTDLPFIPSIIEAKKQRLSKMDPDEAVEALLTDFRERVPVAMFFLLPAFAFMLKLLYIRGRRYYVEHVVFALHSHAFVFALFATLLVVRNDVLIISAILWMPLYLFLAMRRVYGQGWRKTILKFCVLSMTYLLLLSITLMGAVIMTVLLF